MPPCLRCVLSVAVVCLVGCECALGEDRVELLGDGFGDLRPGLLAGANGAETEYHFLPDAAGHGPWAISTFRFDPASQRAWRVVEACGAPALRQTYTNPDRFWHPMLVAGDAAWGDYRVEVEFTPESSGGPSGLVFRYQNDRCYYFFGVDGGEAVLKMVRHATALHEPLERVLASAPRGSRPGEPLRAVVSVDGRSIHAELSGGTVFDVEDDTYERGKIGLTADVPTTFHRVTVTATPAAKARIDAAIGAREREEAELQAANPRPVVWRKISTAGFGVGSYISGARPIDFTADLHEVDGLPVAKRGRKPGITPNPRLRRVI